jgi:hypothetical protein
MCCPSDLDAKMGKKGVMGCCAMAVEGGAPSARRCGLGWRNVDV